jgi:hypothetical protein
MTQEFQSQLEMYQQELQNKNQKLRQVEDDCSNLRITSGQYESKFAALQTEIMELQSAMASLHGELSVSQRECQDLQTQYSQCKDSHETVKKFSEQQGQELVKLSMERELNKKDFQKLEGNFLELSGQYKSLEFESKQRIESLLKEREELQSHLLKKESVLKQQMSTNQELNTMLGKVHNEMMTIREDQSLRENELTRKLFECEEKMRSDEEKSVESEKQMSELQERNVELKKENEKYISEYGNQKLRLEQVLSEQKKMQKRCERLEEEKQEMLMELMSLGKGREENERKIEEKMNEMKEKEEEIRSLQKQMKEMEVLLREKENERRQLSHLSSEQEEKIVTLERQLNEEISLKEQLLESSKVQNKENTSRIIELTTKSSKLSSELLLFQEENLSLKKHYDELKIEKDRLMNQLDEELIRRKVLEKKIQELEDVREESEAKVQSSEREIEELKEMNHRIQKENEQEIIEKNINQKRLIEELEKKSEENLSEVTSQHLQTKRLLEQTHEKTLGKMRESHQKQLEDIHIHKQKEINEYRTRISSLGTAMDELQRELKQESLKNQSLMSEMDSLRELAENNGSELEERYIKSEKDRILERQRTESLLVDLREELAQRKSEILQNQTMMSTLQQELSMEREVKTKNNLNLKKMEEKTRVLEASEESLRSELGLMKKQMKESERKAASQLNVKEEEIQRITRRNEVLSEAMTRMTQGNGTPTHHSSAASPRHSSAASPRHPSASGSASGSSNGVLSYEQYSRQQLQQHGQGHSSSLSRSHSASAVPHTQQHSTQQQQQRSAIPDRIHDGRYMNPTDKPIVSPISHGHSSLASSFAAPVSPLRSARGTNGNGGGNGNGNSYRDEGEEPFEDDSGQYQPPKLSAPSPLEPPGQQQQQLQQQRMGTSPQLSSTKPALRSNSATVRTITPRTSAESYSNAQAQSSAQIRSAYQTQRGATATGPSSNDGGDYGFPVTGGGAGGGLSNEEVNASLSRVQAAINSRRSNSTPRGASSSRATSAPSASASLSAGLDLDPATAAGGATGAGVGIGERSLPIRAEYDSSYASSAQEIYQRDIFSPKSKSKSKRSNTVTGQGMRTEELLSPSLARRDRGQEQGQGRGIGLSVAKGPTLEMDDYGRGRGLREDQGQGDEEDDGEDLLPSQPSMSSQLSKDSAGSGSGSGHFTQKIRHEVECGKDQLLPYSPQRSLRGTSHGQLRGTAGAEGRAGGGGGHGEVSSPFRRKEITASASATSVLSGGAGAGGGGGGGRSVSSKERSHSAARKPSPYLSPAPAAAAAGGRSARKTSK